MVKGFNFEGMFIIKFSLFAGKNTNGSIMPMKPNVLLVLKTRGTLHLCPLVILRLLRYFLSMVAESHEFLIPEPYLYFMS